MARFARLAPPLAPPAWLAVLLGWLVGSGMVARRSCAAPRPPVCSLEPSPCWERPPSPRELRALEGLGPARSTAAAELLWQRSAYGRDLPLDAAHGIGEVTAARVEAWLAGRGAPVAPSWPSAYTPDDDPHGP